LSPGSLLVSSELLGRSSGDSSLFYFLFLFLVGFLVELLFDFDVVVQASAYTNFIFGVSRCTFSSFVFPLHYNHFLFAPSAQ